MSDSPSIGPTSVADRGSRPPSSDPLRVAVVGAGLSGLACSRTLADAGHQVTVLEKSRGPGGRTATRRDGDWRFDHGAQYFTVHDERFGVWVRSWHADGLVAPWDARIAVVADGRSEPKSGGPQRWVGVPGMNAVCRHLAAELEVSYRTAVASIVAEGGGWRLDGEGGDPLGRWDAVVVSAPAPQSAALLEGVAPDLARRAAAVPMRPCWAVMAGFAKPLEVELDGGFVDGGPLSWIARNRSKPGRPDGEAWVLHATPEWSAAHLESDPDSVAEALVGAFRTAVGGGAEPVAVTAHRWRYALPPEPLPEECLFDADLRIAACGDWCAGPRVEGAFLSGVATAGRLLGLAPPERGQLELFGDAGS